MKHRAVTTNEYDEPTTLPQPKVVAATIGAGVGGALTIIGVYIVETAARIDIPAPVETAAALVVTSALSFAAGYFKRPSDKAS